MPPSCGPSRSRILAAVSVSIMLHALLGLGWLAAHGHASGQRGVIRTDVDGPDDRETIFVLREARSSPPAPVRPVEPPSDPPVLPPAITEPIRSVPGPGAPTQSAYSTAPAHSLPKNAGVPRIHGRLKPGESIVYVIDHSASMGADGMLKSAVASVKESLAQLGSDVRFQVVAYNGGTSQVGAELLLANSENIARTGRWLAELLPEGRSDHRAGLREALWFRPDRVYLLTDADDLDEADARAVRALIRTPVSLNAAIFSGHRTTGETPLERLVAQFSGTVTYIMRPGTGQSDGR